MIDLQAAVLQSTVDYIRKLETDNCKLQASNDALLARVEGTKGDTRYSDYCRLICELLCLLSEAQAEGQGQAEAQPQSHDGRFPNTNSPNPSPKDLVNMVEYWRHKYEQERLLRGQTEEHLQRMQYCPLEPITLPMEEYPVSPYQSSSIKIEKVDISSQCPELPPSSSPAQAIPVATTTTPVSSLGERESKRKSSLSCPCGSLTCNVLVQVRYGNRATLECWTGQDRHLPLMLLFRRSLHFFCTVSKSDNIAPVNHALVICFRKNSVKPTHFFSHCDHQVAEFRSCALIFGGTLLSNSSKAFRLQFWPLFHTVEVTVSSFLPLVDENHASHKARGSVPLTGMVRFCSALHISAAGH